MSVKRSLSRLSAIIHCRLVSRHLVVRISSICAPRVPWSDMTLLATDAPTSHLASPTTLRLSVAIFFNYVMMSVLNHRCRTVARQKEITVLFAKVRNADRRLSDWMRANHDDLLAELGSGRIVWRPVTRAIADLAG